MRDVKVVLSRLEPMIVRMDAVITSTLPQLATKAELGEVRAALQQEIAATRSEVGQEIAATRNELKQEIAETRSELKQEIAETRSDLKQEIGATRSGSQQETSDLRTALRVGLARMPGRTYMWGILTALIAAYAAGLAALAMLR